MFAAGSWMEDVQLVHLEIPDYVREPDYEKTQADTGAHVESPRANQGTADCPWKSVTTSRRPVREGSRCLDCGVNTVFDSDKCILCGGCADVCPEVCLELVSLDRMEGDESLQSALSGRLGDDDGSQFSAIIKDETKCIRCALCAERCPVGAITMERVQITSCWTLDSKPAIGS